MGKKRERIMHCRVKGCGKASPSDKVTFKEQMAWLRRHRKRSHPKAHKKSVKKALKTKRKKNPCPKKRGNPKKRKKVDRAKVMKKAQSLLKTGAAETKKEALKRAWEVSGYGVKVRTEPR